MNKKAQTTIFIIVGIVIVAAVLLIFLLRDQNSPIGPSGGPEQSAEAFLDSCLKEELIDAADRLAIEGGFLNHEVYLTFNFSEENDVREIEYLCYQKNYYLPCVNQEPMLFNKIKGEIGEYLEDPVWDCWDMLGQSLEDEGFIVNARKKGYDILLEEGRILVVIDGEMILTKGDESYTENTFRAQTNSNLYGLIKIVQDIISNEAIFCDFDYSSYMLAHRDYSIKKTSIDGGTSIYTIEHRETREKFRFAVRGCVIPPGY